MISMIFDNIKNATFSAFKQPALTTQNYKTKYAPTV